MQLLQGDCLELMKDIPDGSVDMVLTDPPYKTITGGRSDGKNSVRPKGVLRGNKKLFTHQNDIKFSDWIPETYRVLKSGSHCYIFTNSLNIATAIQESENAGFKLHNVLVWVKNNCTPSQYYMKNCEYVLFSRKGNAKWINDIGGSKTAHRFNNVTGNKLHPTEKPIDLLEFYIKNSSNKGDIIFDPFMGSGSTGVACVNTGRNFIGMEIDQGYFQTAQRRIEEAKQAKLA